MSSGKRPQTIEYFFKKRQKSNKHDSTSSTIGDASNSVDLNLEKSNDFIDNRIISDCIENIISNIESNTANDLPTVTGTL